MPCVSRTVTLVLVDPRGTLLGALPRFTVPTPWWPDVGPVVAEALDRYGIDVTVLRLLHATGPEPHGGAVTYLAEVAEPPPGGRLQQAGLREVSETAVLNANYLLARLRDAYELPYDRLCMHEFVLSARRLKREHGATALDVAKRLMDYGFHPPTIYFPLVVPEALMIEPTETETKETLDAFVDAMLAIAREAAERPELLEEAPHTRPVGRLDEVKAVREPVLRWQPPDP